MTLAEEKQDAHLHNPSKDPWSFGEIFNQAFQIAKKTPTLWWFALALGSSVGYSGASNFQLPSPTDFQNINQLLQEPNKQSSLLLTKVLGDSTNPLQDIIQQTIHAIPWYFHAILGIELSILLGISIISFIIYQAWAKAALLHGIESTIKDETVDMSVSSEKAFPQIKSFIWLNIVPHLIFWLISLSLLGCLTVFLIIFPSNMKTFISILLIIAFIVFIIGLLFLTMTSIWAPREVITHKVPAYQAFLKAATIAKKKFWKTLLYAIWKNILTFIMTMLVLIIPLIILGILFFISIFISQQSLAFFIPIAILTSFLFIIWIIAFTLWSGAIQTLTESFWSIAYHKIWRKYEH